jgi:hypothetical protein
MGDVTIKVFNLSLRRLNKVRRTRVRLAKKVLEKRANARKARNVTAISDFEEILKELMSDDAEFAAVSRYMSANEELFLDTSTERNLHGGKR